MILVLHLVSNAVLDDVMYLFYHPGDQLTSMKCNLSTKSLTHEPSGLREGYAALDTKWSTKIILD